MTSPIKRTCGFDLKLGVSSSLNINNNDNNNNNNIAAIELFVNKEIIIATFLTICFQYNSDIVYKSISYKFT